MKPRQGENTMKFSSFDDGTPKGEYLRHTNQEKKSGTKTNDLNADTILNGFKLA
jgi:hypothetical protein